MAPEIVSLVDELVALGPAVHLQRHDFQSGAIRLDVMIGERWFVFEVGPTSGIGVSENIDDNTAFCRHDQYFETVADAASHLLSLVRNALASPNRQAA